MSVTSSVSSNALNFMSSMENGVDPRTGLYTVSVSLPEIQTNDLRGPHVRRLDVQRRCPAGGGLACRKLLLFFI